MKKVIRVRYRIRKSGPELTKDFEDAVFYLLWREAFFFFEIISIKSVINPLDWFTEQDWEAELRSWLCP